MGDEVKKDQVMGLVLSLTQEHIEKFCERRHIEYLEVYATYRRLAAIDSGISPADCLYAMAQAVQMGLPSLGEWLTPIPRQGGKGFSLCFRKDAALYILHHHPDVDAQTIKVWFITGKGEKLEQWEGPSWKALSEVDWKLTCHVEAKIKGVMRERGCPYRNWVSVGQDGNPKFMWMKMASEMLEKQAVKEFVRWELGATLPFDDEPHSTVEITSAPVTDQRSLPASTNGAPPPSDAEERIVAEAAKLGINREQIITAFRGEEEHGVSAEAFLEKLKKDVADREAAAKPRTRKVRSSPKPEIATKGTIDAIAERKREGTGQDYLDIEVVGEKYFVWDKNLFEAAWKAMEDRLEVTLKYTLSGDEGFKEVKSLVLPEPPVEQDAAAGEVTEPEPEKQLESAPELPKEEAPTPKDKPTEKNYLF